MLEACSIVVPIHRVHRYISQALNSTKLAMGPSDELIIVSDGLSTTEILGLTEMLNALQLSDYSIIRLPTTGLVGALNQGIFSAKHDLIARMDSDDVMKPLRLKLQKNFLLDHPKHAFVGGAIELINAEDQLLSVKTYPTDSICLAKSLIKGCFVAHPTVMLRKGAFASVGGYTNEFPFAEDYDLWLRLSQNFAIGNLPHVLLSYRQHPEQISNRQSHIQKKSTLALIEKYSSN